MDERWVPIVVIVALLAIGFLRLFLRLGKIIEDGDFVNKYFQTFKQFLSRYPKSFDGELYSWLNFNINKLQVIIGDFGLIDYRPPFANYIIQNYAVIPNTISLVGLNRDELFAPRAEIHNAQTLLIRYLGISNEWIESIKGKLKNPFEWLKEGTQFVFSVPLLLVGWTGLLDPYVIRVITRNGIFKLITGLITLVGLAASIMTIWLGWDRVVSLFSR